MNEAITVNGQVIYLSLHAGNRVRMQLAGHLYSTPAGYLVKYPDDTWGWCLYKTAFWGERLSFNVNRASNNNQAFNQLVTYARGGN